MDTAMQGYLTRQLVPDCSIQASALTDPIQSLQAALAAALPQSALPPVNTVELYYIRQVNGQTPDGRGIVYYFVPEIAYLIDVGYPRLAMVVLPYEVPTVQTGPGEYSTIGRGDAEFPDFSKAVLFSCAGRKRDEILFPAKARELIVAVKDGATEPEVRKALEPYTESLERQGSYYLATVHAFREAEIASRIESEVELVRYAELNIVLRNSSAPWFVDRVL